MLLHRGSRPTPPWPRPTRSLQGWSKFYEFSFADLRSGADVVTLATAGGSGQPQWQRLHGLLQMAIYGGRVDNTFDAKARLVISLLHRNSLLSSVSAVNVASCVHPPTF